MDVSFSRNQTRSRAFTLLELLVVIAVLVILIAVQVPTFAGGSRQTKVAQCAGNLRQFTMATHALALENDGKFPSNTSGSWAWNLPESMADLLARYGAPQLIVYCPGTAPRFSEADNLQLYNFAPGRRVIGYATTFPGTSLVSTNLNSTLLPPRPQSGGRAVSPAERVLLSDATLSAPGQNNGNQRNAYNYTSISGGYSKPHVSPHLSGTLPLGGNLGMLDGHVEWRQFADMAPRTSGSFSPVFWW